MRRRKNKVEESSISFAVVNKDDLDAVRELLYILEAGFGDEHVKMRDEYIRSLSRPSNLYFICLYNKPIGTFELINKVEMRSFCVLPKYQRRGVGFITLTKLIKIHGDLLYIKDPTDIGRKLYNKFPGLVQKC